MRLKNSQVKSRIELLYSFSFLLLFVGTFLTLIPIATINSKVPPMYMLILGGIILLFLILRGHQNIEFDSDGEALNIKTSEVFWSRYFGGGTKSAEFPKSKLISYKVSRGLFRKTLRLVISSKRTESGKTKLEFNISYLNKSDTSDIKRSLSKILERNKLQKRAKSVS